jgi:predicted transcriptional regulator
MAETGRSIVTLGISSIEETRRQMAAAFRREQQGSYISFASAELLWKVLTAKRWELLQAIAGKGAMSIREAARRAGRDRQNGSWRRSCAARRGPARQG